MIVMIIVVCNGMRAGVALVSLFPTWTWVCVVVTSVASVRDGCATVVR